MNHEDLEKIFKSSHSVNLSEAEKGRIRAHILHTVENTSKTVQSSANHTWQYFFYRHSMSVAFIAVLFFSGATSALAEFAFPGDVLYPIKTTVNEQVLGWFARNPQSQAEWQLSLAERRLKEVRYIAHDSTVSPAVKELAEKNLNDQIHRIEVGNEESVESSVATLRAEAPHVETMSVMMVSKKSEDRAISIAEQKTKESTTTEKIKSDERRKRTEEKIANLKKALSEKKDIKRDSRIRLKGELILSEKALLDSEMQVTGESEDQINEHFEKAEIRIKNVESHLEEEEKQ